MRTSSTLLSKARAIAALVKELISLCMLTGADNSGEQLACWWLERRALAAPTASGASGGAAVLEWAAVCLPQRRVTAGAPPLTVPHFMFYSHEYR